ncbi:MAG TPA: hypothetical protein VMY42_06930 [Thermoguttaceae bacterium]|nr:hypothetical protein [Thermoguttaceae bacterium]
MNVLFEAALEFQHFCRDRNWRHCIIGGLAAIRWGEPRGTRDVDVSLLTGFGDEARYVDAILAQFEARIHDARQFALENRVLLVHAANGIPIDVALAAIPFEERLIERATPFAFAPGVSLATCSAEDLVILKVFAGRQQDWVAVEGILARQRTGLDWTYIDEQLLRLCELREDTETLRHLQQLRRSLDAP